MNSLYYNGSYLLYETELHAEVSCFKNIPNERREGRRAVKSSPLIPLMSELNSNWGGAHLTEHESLLYYSLKQLSLSWKRCPLLPGVLQSTFKRSIVIWVNNLNDFWWIAHMGSWGSRDRYILENEIGEWVNVLCLLLSEWNILYLVRSILRLSLSYRWMSSLTTHWCNAVVLNQHPTVH